MWCTARIVRTLLLSILILSSLSGHAGKHYIRAGATGDTCADWGRNACSDLPTTLVRGDTYYVATGTYAKHLFKDSDSGSTIIRVQAATIADHGTETGWNNAYQGQAVFRCVTQCGAIWEFDSDYYLIDGVYRSTRTGNPHTDWMNEASYGFKVDNTDAHAAGADISGGAGYKGSPNFVHDITIRYVDVSGAHPTEDTGQTYDSGIDFEGGSYNLMFDHLYVHDDYVPFFLKGNHNRQNGGGWTFGPGSNITIQYVAASHNFTAPNPRRSDHHHGAFCSCSEGLTNFTVKYNWIENIVGTSVLDLASGAGVNSGNGSNGPWFVYGNVWTQSDSTHCAVGQGFFAPFDATFGGDVYVLNNTIANVGASNCPGQIDTGFTPALTTKMRGVYWENNLYYRSDHANVINSGRTTYGDVSFTNMVWDYNSWFSTPTSAKNDKGPHRQISASNPFVNDKAFNFRLLAHSAAGANTHSLVPDNDADMNGTVRGSEGVWDRGAFQKAKAPAASTGGPQTRGVQ
jgi:hypothetical protein